MDMLILSSLLASQIVLIFTFKYIYDRQKAIQEDIKIVRKDFNLMNDAILQYCEELDHKIIALSHADDINNSNLRDYIYSFTQISDKHHQEIKPIIDLIQSRIEDLFNTRTEMKPQADQMETLKSAFKGPTKSVKKNERS